jgi:hypothetical protein
VDKTKQTHRIIISVKDTAPSLNLKGIVPANDGSIWFGSGGGLHHYDGKTFTEFKSKEAH